jgi:hypothetical protein
MKNAMKHSMNENVYRADGQWVTPPRGIGFEITAILRTSGTLIVLAVCLLAVGHATSWRNAADDSSDVQAMTMTDLQQGYATGLVATQLDTTPEAFVCGHFVNPVQATYSSLDSVYFDRFGNVYNRDFEYSGSVQASTTRSACYFDLIFGDPIVVNDVTIEFTPEMIAIFETVFEELCEHIAQRQLYDPCDNPLPQQQVHIRVEWHDALPAEVVAAASPLYFTAQGQCSGASANVVPGMPEYKINGHYVNPLGWAGVDGMIWVNPEFANDFDTDYPDPVGSGLIDLYTTVMHEAFHVLGFVSQVEADVPEFYSPMDRLLYVPGESDYFVETACTSACYHENFSDIEKATLSQDECGVTIGPSGPGTHSGTAFGKGFFSHLAADADACGGDYLMQAITPAGVRRYPQEAEWNILCQLGYDIDVNTTELVYDCDGCYLFAEISVRQPTEGGCLSGECCQHDFNTCEDKIEIAFEDILCRVYSSDPVTIIDASSDGADVSIVGETVLVERTSFGLKRISFTVEGCTNCQTAEGLIFVSFDQCISETCEPVDACENLLCFDDFEEFEKALGVNFGYPYIFEGHCNNTPDIKDAQETFNYLFLSSEVGESVCFAFDDTQFEQCDLELELEFFLSSPDLELTVWFSESPPCHGEFVPFGCESISVLCADQSTYEPVCVGLDISEASFAHSQWHVEKFLIPRAALPSGAGFIILSAYNEVSTGSVHIRTIALRPACDPEFDVTTISHCLEACFSVSGMPQSAHWDFGDSNSSTDINPCHTYLSAGTYYVKATFSDGLCKYEQIIEVRVEECGGVDLCEEYGEIEPDWIIGEEPCDVSLVSTEFLGDTYSGIKIAINGTLRVDKDIRFENCIFEMGPHAEILVIGGKLLDIRACVFYSCEYLWRSIRIAPHGKLEFNPMEGTSHILGAWAGVFAHTLSRLSLNDVVFENNMIGLYIPPVPSLGTGSEPGGPPSSLPNMIQLDAFDNLKFIATDDLLPTNIPSCGGSSEWIGNSNIFTVTPGNIGYCGVLMYDVPWLELEAASVGSSNLFQGLVSGIIAYRSGLRSLNNRFKSLQAHSGSGSYPDRGYGIALYGQGAWLHLIQRGYGMNGNVSFEDVRVPIHGSRVNLDVRDNRMTTNISHGIWTSGCQNNNVILANNYIEANHRGIFNTLNDPVNIQFIANNEIDLVNEIPIGPLHNIANADMGFEPVLYSRINNNLLRHSHSVIWNILTQNSKRIEIESNITFSEISGISVINGNQSMVRLNKINGGGSSIGEGLRFFDSQSNWVLCNEITDFKDGLIFADNNAASTISQNKFYGGFQRSMYYNDKAFTGVQANMKNEWCDDLAVQGGHEAYHAGGEFELLNSIYRIETGAGECYTPDPMEPVSGWFFFNMGLSQPSPCSEYSQDDRRGLGDFEDRIAQDSIAYDEEAPALLWNYRWALYTYLTEWPDTSWTGIYGDFLAQMDTSDIGAWYSLEQDIYKLMLPDTHYVQLIEGIQDTLDQAWLNILQYRVVLDTTTSSVDSLNAIAGIQAVLQALEGFAEEWDERRYLADSLRTLALHNMLDKIDNAPAADDWTEALQTVWAGYLEWILDGMDTLSTPRISDLADLATACSRTHGHAVYLAGSMLLGVTEDTYTYECPAIEPLISDVETRVSKTARLHLMPNPAGNWLTIQLEATNPGGEILITHISGTLYARQRVANEVMELNIAHLPAGMYIVSWIGSNETTESRMLIIQR